MAGHYETLSESLEVFDGSTRNPDTHTCSGDGKSRVGKDTVQDSERGRKTGRETGPGVERLPPTTPEHRFKMEAGTEKRRSSTEVGSGYRRYVCDPLTLLRGYEVGKIL